MGAGQPIAQHRNISQWVASQAMETTQVNIKNMCLPHILKTAKAYCIEIFLALCCMEMFNYDRFSETNYVQTSMQNSRFRDVPYVQFWCVDDSNFARPLSAPSSRSQKGRRRMHRKSGDTATTTGAAAFVLYFFIVKSSPLQIQG